MKAIGIIGTIGAGKDTVAEYIAKKYGFSVVSYRDIVREVVENEGLEPNRENMQAVARKYRDKYGEHVFADMALEKAKKIKGNILLKEMRTLGDIEVPKMHFSKNLIIIAVDAKPDIRFRRLRSRGRRGDPKDFKEFLKHEQTEKNFGYYDGMRLADFRVENNETLKELYKKVDNIMKKIEKS